MSSDSYNLQRFVDAQVPCIDHVLAELGAGQKRTHWMWFIFPQMRGLGHSAMAQHYSLSDLDEARAYLAHPVLGPRLIECTNLVLAARPRSVEDIFGYPDHLKFHSSMTLFAETATDVPAFADALAAFFDGERDGITLSLLGAAGSSSP